MAPFIVIEGIDGSGKSSLARGLCHIINQKIPAKATLFAEPTRGEYGLKIRQILADTDNFDQRANQELLRLFYLDRQWDLKTNILPALEQGQMVILDRYFFSTAAYQGHNNAEALNILHSYLIDADFRLPDLIFYLDIPPKQALSRIQNRADKNGVAVEAFETLEKLILIEANYRAIWQETLKVRPQLQAKLQTLDANVSEDRIADRAAAYLQSFC